jgi:hypothetical protein
MPLLAELYVAARTRNVEDADTDDLPVLVVKRGPNIVFSKPLFGGSSRVARGAGAVWRFDMREANLDSADLSFELHASGDDAWAPEHVIVWGINGRVGDERVIPLAGFLDLATPTTHPDAGTWISTDTSEGERILFIPSVERGRDATRARRLIVVCATDPYGGMFPAAVGPRTSFEAQGTSASVTLQGGAAGRLFLSYTLPATGVGGNLQRGEGAFFIVDLAAPFSRQDLDGGAFTLTIQQFDEWVPDYFAVFGVDTTRAGPRALIPFVAASAFELKIMSSDSARGFHSVVLPTARVFAQITSPDVVDPDDLGGVLAARVAPHPPDAGPRNGTTAPKARKKAGRR